jgi:MOSC domain-containing protein YiiM
MATGTVQKLYISMQDFLRPGHRMSVDYIECDPGGIVDDMNYEEEGKNMILLVSQKSYDIIKEADLILDKGVLMENIFVDIDLDYLKPGSLIEIGEVIFEVTGPCMAFNYLYGFAPELPELLQNNRGIFVKPVEDGRILLNDKVEVLKEA